MSFADHDIASGLPDARRIVSPFAQDVRFYLQQDPRQLPSRYLYDALGSALFNAICHLPWYRITRAETNLLMLHASSILASVDPLGRIVELGAGGGDKLAVLLRARLARATPVDVHLVDVSSAALDLAALALRSFEGVRVSRHEAAYEAGLDEVFRDAERQTLVLFLGSNIGNFDPPGAGALLRRIRQGLRRGDALLLGADLVKPEPDLLLAYDDPLGLTAAFNLNLLVRANRELGANFELPNFRHRAVWNAEASRIEMHLASVRRQTVSVPGADLKIAMGEGEMIWTESSYKFSPDAIVQLLDDAGFRTRRQWIDADAGFALTLAGAA